MEGFVSRKEDMSQEGELQLYFDSENNDIHLTVFTDRKSASVEFCCTGLGGGKSPETMQALRNLAEAIKKDNESEPLRKGNRNDL